MRKDWILTITSRVGVGVTLYLNNNGTRSTMVCRTIYELRSNVLICLRRINMLNKANLVIPKNNSTPQEARGYPS